MIDKQILQSRFISLMHRHEGKGVVMNIPFYGGFITLKMEFSDGMIDLVSATSNVMGEVSRCDAYFATGFTRPEGLAKSAAVALEKFSEAGLSYEAKMFNDAKSENI